MAAHSRRCDVFEPIDRSAMRNALKLNVHSAYVDRLTLANGLRVPHASCRSIPDVWNGESSFSVRIFIGDMHLLECMRGEVNRHRRLPRALG